MFGSKVVVSDDVVGTSYSWLLLLLLALLVILQGQRLLVDINLHLQFFCLLVGSGGKEGHGSTSVKWNSGQATSSDVITVLRIE